MTQLTYSNSLTRYCVGFSQLISFICFECSRNKHVLEFFVKLEGSVERTCCNSTSYVSSTKDYVVFNRHIALWIWESDKLKATRRNTLLSFIRGEYNEKRVQWKIVKYTVGWTVFVNNVERVCIPFCSFLSILSFFFPLRFKFSRNWINDKVERCWKVDNFLDTLSSLLAWINVKWNIFLEVNKNKIFSKNIEINLMKNFDIRVNFK